MRTVLSAAAVFVAMWVASSCTVSISNAVDVAVGEEGACLVNTEGGVECWGQLRGLDDTVVVDYGSAAVAIREVTSGATDLTMGSGHACAIVFEQVKCWGANASGQLGDGTYDSRRSPTGVVGLPSGDAPMKVEAFALHTCVLLESGALWCWGLGLSGELGDGASTSSNIPVEVVGFNGSPGFRATDFSIGKAFTCATRPKGSVECWGFDYLGQLGNGPGSTTSSAIPTPVPGLTDVATIHAGHGHVCSVSSAGDIHCWGANTFEAIGIGSGVLDSPTLYTGFPQNVIRISGGSLRNCVVGLDNSAACVGRDQGGALGSGVVGSTWLPRLVVGTDTDPVAEIDTGFDASCAVGTGGDVRCWGQGAYGQLGNGDTANSLVPVSVIRAS